MPLRLRQNSSFTVFIIRSDGTVPHIEIDSKDKTRVDNLMRFIKDELKEYPTEARFVFAVEILRFCRPEFDELKRRKETG